MECEACTDRLVELLYEELPDADADAARAHLDACEPCAQAFERISLGHEMGSMLTLEEPPEGARASIMEAARAKATERAPTPQPAAPSVERTATAREEIEQDEDRGWWASILHWLGGLAMRPQLAMAMTLFLMVGIGLWYLDVGQRHDPAGSQAIVDPAPGDEAGPSRTLAPAEPLDLEADPRTGRIRPRDELAAESAARGRRSAASSDEVAEPAAASDRSAGLEALADEPNDGLLALDTEAEAPAEGATTAGDVSDSIGSPEAALAEMDQGAAQTYARADEAPPPSAPSESSAADVPRAEGTAPSVGGAAAPAGTEARYERGMQRYQQRDYAGAAQDFESVVRRPDTDARRLLPAALHQLARSHRASGDCRAAVRSYEQLLGRYGTYGRAPEAMLEAADCYRRTGQLGAARRWLEQAARTPRVAPQARRALAELSTAERVHERATTAEQPAE